MAHLLSERVKNLERVDITKVNLEGAPAGFKLHPKPLGFDWGMPNAESFPIRSIQVDVFDRPFQETWSLPLENSSSETLSSKDIIEDDGAKESANSGEAKQNKILIPKKTANPALLGLSRGLQYSEQDGIPQVLEFTENVIKKAHAPGYDNWATMLCNGAGDGLHKVAQSFLDPGDVILVEEFTFTPFMSNIKLAGGIAVPVKLDLDATPGKSNGLDLEHLTELLKNWDTLKPELKGKKPKALYTIPTGHNPTGFVQSVEFRQKVYDLAEKYDFMIIEDDPYGYLTLPPFSNPDSADAVDDSLSVEEYLKDHLIPSYLNFDKTGRVIRVETLSKMFAPGFRLGFITAHKDVIGAISTYANATTNFSSGIAQLLLNNVVEQSFGGLNGWFEWILQLRLAYIRRRNVLLGALFDSEAYSKGYFSASDPRGLFTKVVVNFPEGTNVPEKMRLLSFKLRAAGMNVVAGLNMAADKEFSAERGNFYRLTYAFADSEEDLREGAKRLASAINEFFEKGLEY